MRRASHTARDSCNRVSRCPGRGASRSLVLLLHSPLQVSLVEWQLDSPGRVRGWSIRLTKKPVPRTSRAARLDRISAVTFLGATLPRPAARRSSTFQRCDLARGRGARRWICEAGHGEPGWFAVIEFPSATHGDGDKSSQRGCADVPIVVGDGGSVLGVLSQQHPEARILADRVPSRVQPQQYGRVRMANAWRG